MAGAGTSETLARMETEIVALREQMARQEAELRRLRGVNAAQDGGDGAARRTSRRRMLKQMGMAAVGVAAMSAAAGTGGDVVDAANGGNLVLGTTNNAESQTAVVLDGAINPAQVFFGAGGPASLTLFRAAIAGAAVTTNNPVGVYGFSNQIVTNSCGVVGSHLSSGTGVYGTSGTGTGVGGNISSANVAVYGNNGGSGPGVQGQSATGHGLIGITSATDGAHTALIGSVQPGGMPSPCAALSHPVRRVLRACLTAKSSSTERCGSLAVRRTRQ
jgi:hypothetical protein